MSIDLWTDLISTMLEKAPRVLLYGPPGTGKTYAANRLGLKKNQKVYSVTLTEETPASELRGHFVPKGGEFIWTDGPAVSAWREGARLVLNEIDHAGPDCLSLLHAILDDPEFTQLTLPTKETIRPAPGFSVVATMNGEPEDLPFALADRFPIKIKVEEVNPEALNQLPKEFQKLYKELHKRLGNKLDTYPLVSLRAWLEFTRLVFKENIDKDTAGLSCFGSHWVSLKESIKLVMAPKEDI